MSLQPAPANGNHALDLLADALTEHNPDASDPASWPAWTDAERWTSEPYTPTPEDEADYRAWCQEVDRRQRESDFLDWHERRQYERFYGCNARFV